MIGDVLRRLVGRVLVQAVALRLETACLPYTSTASALVLALRLCHASSGLQLKSTLVQQSCPWTQWAPMITFLGRQCWRALHARPELRPLLPYAWQFYGAASLHVD